MMVRAEPADTARRGADHGARLTAPCALAIGPRSDIDGVLQRGRHRAVMLGRDEENGVSSPDPLAKLRPCYRRILIIILIVDRQVSDLDEAEFQSLRCHLYERVSHLAIDRIFPQ